MDNSVYKLELTNSLKVVPNTRYQLRFCVQGHEDIELKLKIINKNNNGDVREVNELTLLKQDYDKIGEYNDLIYSNYNTELGIDCEYYCNDFVTLPTAQNIELYLESDTVFKISDVTLQRVTVNHFDSEYMRTDTDYNSCVYDLYADYKSIPTNIRYENVNIFSEVLNKSLPLAKIGYFNPIIEDTTLDKDMKLVTETNVYISNMFDVAESGVIDEVNHYNDITNHTYNFNKYVKKGEYEIILKAFSGVENNIVSDFEIDIEMLVFKKDNTAYYEKIKITDVSEYIVNDENGKYFKIPFMNKSDNSFNITLHRENNFSFKDFKLERKTPLTLAEMD